MTIGERIKKRRNELKWSQRELSDRMGYSNHSTITKIEAGKVDIPQSRIVQFAEVLNVSVADLMGWNDKIEENPVKMAEHHFEIIMDEDFTDLFEDFKKLTPEGKKMAKKIIHSLVDETV